MTIPTAAPGHSAGAGPTLHDRAEDTGDRHRHRELPFDIPVNRRDLFRLTALGGSIAAGLVPVAASADSPNAFRSAASPAGVALGDKPIIVLGAGITGLVTAYELLRAGHSCVVLEARDRVGGKMETVRSGSVVEEIDSRQVCTFTQDESLFFNTGPTRIPQHHAGVVGYCRELGVPLSLWQNENRSAYFYSPKVGRVRLRQVIASLRGNVAALAAEAVWLHSHLDEGAVLAAVQQFGDLDVAYQFTGSTRAGLEPGTGRDLPAQPAAVPDLAAVAAIAPFQQFMLNGTEYLDQQASMLQVDGGVDRLAEALFDRVRSTVLLGSVVTAVNRTSSGARIEYTRSGRSESLEADNVVVTIPAPVLREIPHSFSDEVTTALSFMEYTSSAKLAFEADRFWETDDQIYGGISLTEDDITQLIYPAHDFGRSTGCLVGTYMFGFPQGDGFAALTPAQRIETVLTQGERVHPQLRQHTRQGISRSWLKTPFSLGGWSIVPPPNVLQEPDGPFLFAGDYTTHLSGWMEGGVASAHRAVRQLLDNGVSTTRVAAPPGLNTGERRPIWS